MIHLIEGQLRRRLEMLAKDAYPNEAVGLLFPDERIVSLTNIAEDPHSNFSVAKEELVKALQYAEENDWHIDEVVLWHSHPSGGVGPSRVDFQQRTPLKHHLVVTLTDEDFIPTWY